MSHRLTANDLILDRRDFLRRCGMGFGGLALGGLMTGNSSAAMTGEPSGPHFAPKAKRVVHLFMNGGPSQVDTFDPKPQLQLQHGKPIPLDGLKTERPTGTALTAGPGVTTGRAVGGHSSIKASLGLASGRGQGHEIKPLRQSLWGHLACSRVPTSYRCSYLHRRLRRFFCEVCK